MTAALLRPCALETERLPAMGRKPASLGRCLTRLLQFLPKLMPLGRLLRITGRFVEVYQSFRGLGQFGPAVRGNRRHVRFQPLVSEQEKRLGLGVLLLPEQAPTAERLNVGRRP